MLYKACKRIWKAARPPEGCPPEAGGLFGPESAISFDRPSGRGQSRTDSACRCIVCLQMYMCSIQQSYVRSICIQIIYSRTSAYENHIIRKIQNTKQASKRFPFNEKYSRYENENRKCPTWKVKGKNIYYYNNGVMVIVAGYGHGDTSSNRGWDWLHFT